MFRCLPYGTCPRHEYTVLQSVFAVPDHHGNIPTARSRSEEPDSTMLNRVVISGTCSEIGSITVPLVVNGVSLHRPESPILTTTRFRINIGPVGADGRSQGHALDEGWGIHPVLTSAPYIQSLGVSILLPPWRIHFLSFERRSYLRKRILLLALDRPMSQYLSLIGVSHSGAHTDKTARRPTGYVRHY